MINSQLSMIKCATIQNSDKSSGSVTFTLDIEHWILDIA